MGVDNPNVIDAIGIDCDTGEVVLTISDHLEWANDQHLLVLQEKINTYLAFIESGEIDDAYQAARGRSRRIDLVAQFEPTGMALEFLPLVEGVLREAGIGFRQRLL